MDPYKIVIMGQPPSKKTKQRMIRTKRGRTVLLPNEEYEKWEPRAIWAVKIARMEYAIDPITKPMRVACLFYRAGHGRVDLVNLLQSPHDVLTRGKFIKDDYLIKSVDGSRVILGVDEKDARVEIFIWEMDPSERTIA